MIRVHVWYEFGSSSSLLLRLRRASSTFSWLRRLRALPSGLTALTTGRRDRTRLFCVYLVWMRLNWRKKNQILYRAWKSTRSYSVGLQLRRHLFYCRTWISPCWLRHTGSTQIHIIPTAATPKTYQRGFFLNSDLCPRSRGCGVLTHIKLAVCARHHSTRVLPRSRRLLAACVNSGRVRRKFQLWSMLVFVKGLRHGFPSPPTLRNRLCQTKPGDFQRPVSKMPAQTLEISTANIFFFPTPTYKKIAA